MGACVCGAGRGVVDLVLHGQLKYSPRFNLSGRKFLAVDRAHLVIEKPPPDIHPANASSAQLDGSTGDVAVVAALGKLPACAAHLDVAVQGPERFSSVAADRHAGLAPLLAHDLPSAVSADDRVKVI